MRTCDLSRAVRQIRKAVFLENGDSLTDGQLLESFLVGGEEAAFETLVHRHGQMVLGVCRRVLRNTHDAEDAFQATFLVLIRKARSIKPPEMVAHWLYGVAYRTALEARKTAYKRDVKEKELRQMANANEKDENTWSELHSLLDRELTGLPKKYRVAILLCDLEGKTRKEAAGLLQLPEGTLSTRLARGRALLAKRMTRRGIALAGGSLTMALGQNATASLPSSLAHTTVKAGALLVAGQTVTGITSPAVIALMEGVMKTMLLTKLKVVTAIVFAIGVIGTANLMVYRSMAVEPAQVPSTELPLDQDSAPPKADATPKKDKQKESAKPVGQENKDEKAHGLPAGQSPYWVCASIAKDGKIIVGIPVVTYKTVATKIKKDGEEKEAYYYEPVAKETVKTFDASDVKAFDVQGKPCDSKKLAKLLEKKTLVLCSSDSRKVDPFYLRIIKDGTVVLVISKPLWDVPVYQPGGYIVPPSAEPPIQPSPPPEDSRP